MMTQPVAIGICEDDLRRDLAFLKEFAGPHVDFRVTPLLHRSTLEVKAARLVKRQAEAMRAAGLPVRTLVVHHDVDRASHAHRVAEIKDWFDEHGLHALGLGLVVCAPDPCLERWLCVIEGRSPRHARPSAGGDPWKKAWAKGKGIDLDRVREAARAARSRLRGLPDFDSFHEAWKAAQLEPRGNRDRR